MTPDSAPTTNPWPHGTRPTASFLLLAYNQERYVEEAVRAALAQTYEPLEIILSDDGSKDQTFAVMERVAGEYTGTHRVILNRNEKNLGLTPHFNRLVEMASGEFIVMAAGDDVSLPERTEESWRLFEQHPGATCVSLRLERMDATGKTTRPARRGGGVEVLGLNDFLTPKRFPAFGASRAFLKSVHTYFGPLSPRCPSEDSPTQLRCLLLGKTIYGESAGVRYRTHDANLWAGGGFRRVRHQRIFRQESQDIRLARERGLISPALARGVRRKVGISYKRVVAMGEFGLAEKKLRYFFGSVLCSGAFDPKRKLRLFRDALRGSGGRNRRKGGSES